MNSEETAIKYVVILLVSIIFIIQSFRGYNYAIYKYQSINYINITYHSFNLVAESNGWTAKTSLLTIRRFLLVHITQIHVLLV